MKIAFRISLATYIVLVVLAAISIFVSKPAWPALAFNYFEWRTTQSIDSFTIFSEYAALCLMSVSWLSAIALSCGKRLARWSFSASILGVLFLEVGAVIAGQLPMIIDVSDAALNDLVSVVGGLIVAQSFYPESSLKA